MNNDKFWIGGRQNVLSVLNEKICLEILIDEKRKDANKYKMYKKVKLVSKKNIDMKFSTLPSYSHQGFAALINQDKIKKIEDCFKNEINLNILAIDDVQDIGNYGTIIRSCVAFGINTILLKKNNLTKKLSLIFKNSAGAFKHINIIYTSNIFNEIKKFKNNDYMIVSLDAKSDTSISSFKWYKKNLIIIGSEDKGIKKNILKKSDFIIKIDTNKNLESLNVAQATSICLYDLSLKKITSNL